MAELGRADSIVKDADLAFVARAKIFVILVNLFGKYLHLGGSRAK